jgi:hypothetical protein
VLKDDKNLNKHKDSRSIQDFKFLQCFRFVWLITVNGMTIKNKKNIPALSIQWVSNPRSSINLTKND